jgi:nucleotide-binding universal stress UspA family protein
MAIRKILVPLTGLPADRGALAAAFAAAKQCGAHVDGVFLRFDQRDAKLRFPEQLPAGLFDELASLIAGAEAREEQAGAGFEAARLAAQAAAVASPAPPSGAPTARWLGARPAERLIRDAPLADLVVLGRSAADDRHLAALRATVLTTSGRPLLLAPTAPAESLVGPAAVAWNGGAHAARAVAAALPLLTQASAVHVLTARTAKTRSSEGERLAEYLACHGIAAQFSVLSADDRPIGELLLRRAAEIGARLFVMGGQSRPRLHDLLFGGVTRHAFEAATLPVLIAN